MVVGTVPMRPPSAWSVDERQRQRREQGGRQWIDTGQRRTTKSPLRLRRSKVCISTKPDNMKNNGAEPAEATDEPARMRKRHADMVYDHRERREGAYRGARAGAGAKTAAN